MERWKAGDRYPRLEKPVFDALDQLIKRNRIPKNGVIPKVVAKERYRHDICKHPLRT